MSSFEGHRADATVPATVVAAFDLDGTLTKRDTLLPFLRFVCGRATMSSILARHATGLLSMQLARDRRDDVKRSVIRAALSGRPSAQISSLGELFASRLLTSGAMCDIVVAEARRHLELGHEVIVVSASPALYVAPLARQLGLRTALATELAVDEEGHLTGELQGPNCRGPEKVRRLEEWLAGRAIELHAYGNSEDDAAILASADVGVRVVRRPLQRPRVRAADPGRTATTPRGRPPT